MSSDILNQILISLGDIKQQQGANTATITAILAQAQKTNGRVNGLENTTTNIAKIQGNQDHLMSKMHGAFLAHQQLIETRIVDNEDFAKREINEFKKSREIEVKKTEAKTPVYTALIASITAIIMGVLSINK